MRGNLKWSVSVKKLKGWKQQTLEAAQAEAQQIKQSAQEEGYANGFATGQKGRL